MTEQAAAAPIVRYAEYAIEEFEKDASRAKQIGGGALMELSDGPNVVRFIPPKLPGITPMRSTGMHFVELPGVERTVAFACPQKELGTPCPVCAYVEQMRQSQNPIDRQRADRMAVGLKIYSNVVDRGAPADDPNHGLRVLGYGKTVLEQLKTIRRNASFGGDFFRPDPTGFDIVIVKEGEGMRTRYKVVPERSNSPLAPDPAMTQALIDNQYDLNQYVTPVVPEEILVALQMQRQAHGIPAGRQAPPVMAASTSGWGASPSTQVADPVAAAFGRSAPPVGASLFGGAPVPPARVVVPGQGAALDVDFTSEAAPDEVEYDENFNPIKKA